MKILRIRARRLSLALGLAVVLLASSGSSCSTHVAPKVVIDTADRAAYDALRTFQTAEEAAWHANAGWPTPEQHKTINGKVSKAYTLIIDVARIGIALPPGSTLSIADLAVVAQLTTAVADIVDLANGTSVQTQATAAQTKVGALVAGVSGVKP